MRFWLRTAPAPVTWRPSLLASELRDEPRPRRSPRAVHDRSSPRRGRHGRGVPGARLAARTRGRPQAAARGRLERSRPARSLREGSEAARRAQPSQHRARLRLRAGGFAFRPGRPHARDGARRRRGPGSPSRARPDRAGRGARGRPADRGGARRGAREGDRPPRSQASQRQADAGRPGQDPRLRAGEGRRDRRTDRSGHRLGVADAFGADHTGGSCLRHTGLHVSRAGARPSRGQADRRLGIRLPAVRDARGSSTLRGAHDHRHARGDPVGRPSMARAAPDDSGVVAPTAAPMPREGRKPPPARHRRRARGHRRSVRRPRGHARARPRSPAAAAPPPAGARARAAARGHSTRPGMAPCRRAPVGPARDRPHHDRAAARPEAVLRRCHLRPGTLVGRPPARLRRRAGRRHPALGQGAQQPRVEAARWNGGCDAPVLLSRRRVDRLLCGWRAAEGGRLRRSAAPHLHREGAKPRRELGARRPHRVRAVGVGAARRRGERRRAPAHREPRERALAGDPAGRPDGALHHATSLRDHVHRRERVPRGRDDHRLAARRTRRPGDGHAGAGPLPADRPHRVRPGPGHRARRTVRSCVGTA